MSYRHRPARPQVNPDIRVVVHRVFDHRGHRQFLVTVAGKQLCFSKNPIVCAAVALLGEGHAPSGIEEVMRLSEAIEWQMAGLGEGVPMPVGAHRHG
jgi:hypothetical protein